MVGQNPGIEQNRTIPSSGISWENAYVPFEVGLDTWYENPEKTISFKIEYTPIAGTNISPFGLVCQINGQLTIGKYGGPIREIIIPDNIYMQGVLDMNLVIDLRTMYSWVQAHYYGKWLPLYFLRNEISLFGVWMKSDPMETAAPATDNPVSKPIEQGFCVSCSGMGSRQCNTCAGTGYTMESVAKSVWNSYSQTYETRYEHERRTCTRCIGGRIVCSWCNGRGY